jgi:gluconokinase
MTTDTPAEVVIGLDVGTTGAKAVAFDLKSSSRHVAIREHPLLEAKGGQHVQDPDAMVAASAAALTECVAAAGEAEVVAVSLSAAMHGLMALDADLRPLTPLVTWADGRARAQAASLHESGRAAGLQALTGAPVHPMTPLTKLMWFSQCDRDTWAAARWWIGLKDYLLLWLTGRLATELSSASGTGMLDMSARAWSPAALALSGVSESQLSDILPTTATLPLARAAARQVGLAAGTPVAVGAADGPLGNLGTGAVAPGVAGLSLGTSGAIRMAVHGPRADRDPALFCYALTDAIWVVGSAISNGGGVMRWAASSLVPDVAAAGADIAVLELAAGVPAGSQGLVMLPYLVAERGPLWDPDLPGVLLGLRREHTRAHMVRAALEGVCLQMRLLLEQVEGVEPVTRVVATGGVFRSVLWREVMAATLGRRLDLVGDAEGTALGAAALGLLAIGRARSLDEAVGQLAPPGATDTSHVDPDAALVAVYARSRASVPELLERLSPLGRLFAS